jgi:hypothetical protein
MVALCGLLKDGGRKVLRNVGSFEVTRRHTPGNFDLHHNNNYIVIKKLLPPDVNPIAVK